MKLIEVMNRPVEWNWLTRGPQRWIAEIHSLGVHVKFTRTGGVDSPWMIAFERDVGDRVTKTERLTGTGGEFAVFSTVLDTVRVFLQEKQPKSVMFVSVDTLSRIRLYNRFMNKFADSVGYTPITDSIGRFGQYELVRNDE